MAIKEKEVDIRVQCHRKNKQCIEELCAMWLEDEDDEDASGCAEVLAAQNAADYFEAALAMNEALEEAVEKPDDEPAGSGSTTGNGTVIDAELVPPEKAEGEKAEEAGADEA